MTPAFALSYGVHRQDLQPDGSWRAAEWRLVEVGGPLLMVTQREPLARLLAEAPALLAVLRALTTHPHVSLGDLVYAVRDAEGLGWDGPSVKAWSDAVTQAQALLARVDGAA
jgi:hypothetical protein